MNEQNVFLALACVLEAIAGSPGEAAVVVRCVARAVRRLRKECRAERDAEHSKLMASFQAPPAPARRRRRR